MTITELLQKLQAEGEHETYPVASPSEIAATESALGQPLPDSYKEFVSGFSNGAYLFLVQEVSGVGDGNDQIGPIQGNLHDDSQDESIPFREGGEALYGDLIPFGYDSNGNEWCFVLAPGRPGNEYECAYFDATGRKLYGRLGGFSEWLGILVEKQDEVIRTMYDEDVLYDELGLG
jgi:hypothetical protein